MYASGTPDSVSPGAEDVHDRFAVLFTALSDPVRLAIIDRLSREGEMSVGRLSEPFDITAPAISRHLKVLEHARLIERRIHRQWRICSLNQLALTDACVWLHQVTSEPAPAGLRAPAPS